MKKKLLIAIILLCIGAGLWVYTDISSNNRINKISAKPEVEISGDATKVLWALENGENPDFENLLLECEFIDGRYDKSDFSVQTLVRLLYDYEESIPDEVKDEIKKTLTGFKFWMDQPGEDGMCYWSENHQILFFTGEYLIGQYYLDVIFANDNKTGLEHKDMAKIRILIWLEQRWLYGFSEWYSNTYYKEDLLALSNLIDFAKDEEIVIKSKMIMDLLLHDVASQSYKGTFVTTSGRLYEDNKKSGQGNRLNRVEEYLFGFDLESKDSKNGLDLNFLYMNNYQMPDVIKEIALDEEKNIIKASNGLNVSELESEGLLGLADNQIMMQWGMEAFTNPETITNSLKYIEANNMFSNEFLYDFRLMNIDLLKLFKILPLASEGLDFKTNGVAIQRANTYTFKTNEYMLATAQSYHPGEFADQQHIWTATLSNDVSIFTTHPALPLSDKAGLTGSPNYWVGSGRLPHSVQEENVNISLYVVPNKKGFMEEYLLDYTHAYFPKDLMDEVILEENYIFGKLGNAYIAMIGKENLYYKENSSEDLIQKGKITYWITELSSSQSESFEAFKKRIKSNTVDYNMDGNQLSYTSEDKEFLLTYNKDFSVNNELVNSEYNRFDSPYSLTDRKSDTITIENKGKSLYLDFYNLKREVVN